MADYRNMAKKYAAAFGIPSALFLAMVKQESGFNPRAVSPAGARGLTQLMPGTARGLGVNPDDPAQNLWGGAKYLSDQYKRFGRWDLALSAYNSGPGGSEAKGQVEGFAETQKYVRNIMGSISPGQKAPVQPDAVVLASPMQTFSRENAVKEAKREFATGLLQSMQAAGKTRTDQMLLNAMKLRKSMRKINEEEIKAGQAASAPTVINMNVGAKDSDENPGSLDALLSRLGVADAVTSGLRPGATTRRGTRSYHADDRARDISPGDPQFGSLLAYAKRNPGYFTEFFYDPLGWYIKNGRVVQGSIGGHSDHAHAAR